MYVSNIVQGILILKIICCLLKFKSNWVACIFAKQGLLTDFLLDSLDDGHLGKRLDLGKMVLLSGVMWVSPRPQ